ncbi:MAG: hypothetical protein H0T55_05680 [Rubrobacteraceae bacterium]|nr:hypothetical protein [Rubrobacteraceae bacterium]MBA3635757.1 hypothetical protein [Rubrobacteraceae bacterium]
MKENETTMLWRALYGSGRGLIGVHSALRPAPGLGRLVRHRSSFFAYPKCAHAAARWCLRGSEEGLEAYFCAHLLLHRHRTKENAAPVMALWADADGAPIPPEAPEPTAIVETSPGHAHLFWSLRRPVSPRQAEVLNRRLLVAACADRSGWDLSQLLRPPGTRNRKYEEAPTVRLLELDQGMSYHPRELELALPRVDPPPLAPDVRALPRLPSSPTELCRLSRRARSLIECGNSGAGSPYPSRSEADFAVCLAMFGAGYEEAEVWAVMTDPANGISERTLEKGRHAEGYLALTIGKARAIACGRRSA